MNETLKRKYLPTPAIAGSIENTGETAKLGNFFKKNCQPDFRKTIKATRSPQLQITNFDPNMISDRELQLFEEYSKQSRMKSDKFLIKTVKRRSRKQSVKMEMPSQKPKLVRPTTTKINPDKKLGTTIDSFKKQRIESAQQEQEEELLKTQLKKWKGMFVDGELEQGLLDDVEETYDPFMMHLTQNLAKEIGGQFKVIWPEPKLSSKTLPQSPSRSESPKKQPVNMRAVIKRIPLHKHISDQRPKNKMASHISSNMSSNHSNTLHLISEGEIKSPIDRALTKRQQTMKAEDGTRDKNLQQQSLTDNLHELKSQKSNRHTSIKQSINFSNSLPPETNLDPNLNDIGDLDSESNESISHIDYKPDTKENVVNSLNYLNFSVNTSANKIRHKVFPNIEYHSSNKIESYKHTSISHMSINSDYAAPVNMQEPELRFKVAFVNSSYNQVLDLKFIGWNFERSEENLSSHRPVKLRLEMKGKVQLFEFDCRLFVDGSRLIRKINNRSEESSLEYELSNQQLQVSNRDGILKMTSINSNLVLNQKLKALELVAVVSSIFSQNFVSINELGKHFTDVFLKAPKPAFTSFWQLKSKLENELVHYSNPANFKALDYANKQTQHMLVSKIRSNRLNGPSMIISIQSDGQAVNTLNSYNQYLTVASTFMNEVGHLIAIKLIDLSTINVSKNFRIILIDTQTNFQSEESAKDFFESNPHLLKAAYKESVQFVLQKRCSNDFLISFEKAIVKKYHQVPKNYSEEIFKPRFVDLNGSNRSPKFKADVNNAESQFPLFENSRAVTERLPEAAKQDNQLLALEEDVVNSFVYDEPFYFLSYSQQGSPSRQLFHVKQTNPFSGFFCRIYE